MGSPRSYLPCYCESREMSVSQPVDGASQRCRMRKPTMDAVHNRIPFLKIALPILMALLLMPAPGHATSPSFQLNPSSGSVTLVGGEGGQVSVNSSDGSTIEFNATVNYNGATPWVSVDGYIASFSNIVNLTTPTTLTFQTALVPANTSVTVTLHA